MSATTRDEGDGLTIDSDTEFSVAIFPDTQHYAEQNNGIFEQMCEWVAENRDEFNIQTVLHEGDLVHNYGSNNEDEWDIARDAIGEIDDENVPTVLALGNHDADDLRDPRTFRSRFPASRYEEIERTNETVLDWERSRVDPRTRICSRRSMANGFSSSRSSSDRATGP